MTYPSGILAPDGSELTPPAKQKPDRVLAKGLARTWRWQRLLEGGHLQLDDRNRRGVRVSKSYVIRILRLALLASGFVEAILSARANQSVVLDRLEQP